MKKNKKNIKTFLTSMCIVVLSFLIVFFAIPHNKEYIVVSGKWERYIEIESLQVINESGWDIPYDARNLNVTNKEWKYRYSKKMECGSHRERYTSYGKTYYRNVTDYTTISVYDWYYEYTYEGYKKCREVMTCGTHDKDPYWGEVKLVKHDELRLGDEREGKRSELYSVKVYKSKKHNKTKTYSLSYNDFVKAKPDTKLTFRVSRLFKKAKLVN